MKRSGTSPSGVATAVTLPTSKVMPETAAERTTRPAMTHTDGCRFHGTANATALAVAAYAMLRAQTTLRSRTSIRRGWRSRASPTSRSTPFITYELSVLTRVRVNWGQRLHGVVVRKLHVRLQGPRIRTLAKCVCTRTPDI